MHGLLRCAVPFLAAIFASACGPPPSSCCGRRTNVSRTAVYTASLPLPDGGTPTQVRVKVSSSGNTAITFINDGHEIVEGFDATSITP